MNAAFRPSLLDTAERLADEELHIEVARSLNDLMQVTVVRSLVYMGEQTCPFDEEFDGNDFSGATHLILRKGAEPIGVVRLRWFAEFAKLERLAIRREYRGGPGLMMLARGSFQHAAQKGYHRLMGHAQPRLVPFWKRYFHGRERADRRRFCFSDYDYCEMEFDLQPPADAITIDSDPFVLLRPEGAWDVPGVLDRFAVPATCSSTRSVGQA